MWAKENIIWLSAAHISGKLNAVADIESRNVNIDGEWILNPYIFQQLSVKLIEPDIDLFASILNNFNYQIKTYVSWKHDPEAIAIDPFMLSWEMYNLYAFPPFSLIGRVLLKITDDQAEGLLIVPIGLPNVGTHD